MPLFDPSVRKSKVTTAEAFARELRISWEQEVIRAIQEVYNAMYSISEHQIAVKASLEAVKSLLKVLVLARKDFGEGTAPFPSIFDAERGLLNFENAYAWDRQNLAIDYVNLNVALGGLFDSSQVSKG